MEKKATKKIPGWAIFMVILGIIINILYCIFLFVFVFTTVMMIF